MLRHNEGIHVCEYGPDDGLVPFELRTFFGDPEIEQTGEIRPPRVYRVVAENFLFPMGRRKLACCMLFLKQKEKRGLGNHRSRQRRNI